MYRSARLQRIHHEAQPSRPWHSPTIVAGSLLAAGALVFGATERDGIRDIFFHQPSPQERILEKAVDAAFDTDSAQVNCISQERLDKLFTNPLHRKHRTIGGKALPYTNTMWLPQEQCNTLTDIREHVPKTDDFLESTIGNASPHSPLNQIGALATLAHESGHALMNTSNESYAQCIASQKINELGNLLGYPAALNDQIKTFAGIVVLGQSLRIDESYAIDFGKCQDGGSYDLNLGSTGVFPTPLPSPSTSPSH